MRFATAKISRASQGAAFFLALLLWVNTAHAAGLRYTGRVLYHAGKVPVAGVLVELVEADDDDQPGKEVIGRTHTDAQGHFVLEVDNKTRENVALVVSAVRESASSDGDRRTGGYEVKTRRTRLGVLANPSLTKPNTILIERRKAGRTSGDSDDD